MIFKISNKVFIILLLLVTPLWGEENQTDERVKYFPSVALQLNPTYYFKNTPDYSWHLGRTIDIELLQYKNFSAHFSLRELHLFGDNHKDWNEPSKIIYSPLDFIRLMWYFQPGILGLRLDHECYNIIDKNNVELQMYRWYGAALSWESHAMAVGRKNQNLKGDSIEGFDFISNVEYFFYLGKSLDSVRFDYDYLLKGEIRYDIFQYYNFIPYVELSVRGLVDDTLRFDRGAETGFRLNLANTYLNPYVRYLYQHDVDVHKGLETDFWMVGFRLESLITDESTEKEYSAGKGLLFTRVYVRGGYGRYYGSKYYGYNTNAEVYARLFEPGNLSLNMGTWIRHNSKTGPNQLYPRYLEYSYIANLIYNLEPYNHKVKLYYEYFQNSEGNTFRGFNEKYQVVGMEIYSNGMAIGNMGSDPDNLFDWKITAGKYFQKENYYYDWLYQISLRVNFFYYNGYTLYLNPDISLYQGNDWDYEYGIETGVAKKYALVVNLFYRFDYNINIDRFQGEEDFTHLLGVRFEI